MADPERRAGAKLATRRLMIVMLAATGPVIAAVVLEHKLPAEPRPSVADGVIERLRRER